MLTLDDVLTLRASSRHLPRVTLGGLIGQPFAVTWTEAGWTIWTGGRPRAVAPTRLLLPLAMMHPEELDVILDPAVSPEEAIMDGEARAKRERGRLAAHALAQSRLAEEEEGKRALERLRRERERIARMDLTKLSLDDI